MTSWNTLREQIAPQLDALLKLMADARVLRVWIPVSDLPECLEESYKDELKDADANWLFCIIVDAHPGLALECGQFSDCFSKEMEIGGE